MKQRLLAIIDDEFMSKTEKLDALRVHIERISAIDIEVSKQSIEELQEALCLNDKESK